RARCHRHQELALPPSDALLDGADGSHLVIAQLEVPRRLAGELRVSGLDVLLEPIPQALRRRKLMERPREVRFATRVQKPDAGLGAELLEVRTAIGGEQKRHAIGPPGTAELDPRLGAEALRVALALLEHARHVLVPALGLH